MRIISNNVRKFQEGGPVSPEAAPVEGTPQEMPQGGGEQDPLMQITQMFAQGLQNQDCNMLAQGAQMFLQLMQAQAQGGAHSGGHNRQPLLRGHSYDAERGC